jgi:hypothetical protein
VTAMQLPCAKIDRKQKRLTPEQETCARQFACERIAAIIVPETDERAAEEHLRLAYQQVGLVPPRVRWFDSPWAVHQALLSESVSEDEQDQVRREALSALNGEVLKQLSTSLGGKPPHSLSGRSRPWVRCIQVGGEIAFLYGGLIISSRWLPENPNWSWWVWLWFVGDLLLIFAAIGLWAWAWECVLNGFSRPGIRETLWDGLCSVVEIGVGIQMPAEDLGKVIEAAVNDMGGTIRGGNCAMAYARQGHLALCWFLHELYEPNRLVHLARFNELVSGYYLGRKQAWLVRKPIHLRRDAQGCLHSADGKCLVYRDGWGGYAWHGVPVPEQVMLQPETLTREDWLNERDLEVRRVIQERMPNVVEAIGAQLLDTGQRGVLFAVDLSPDPEGVAHYVRVRDSSTERAYYLRVPPEIQRADEAVAWTFELSEEEYQPEQEA